MNMMWLAWLAQASIGFSMFFWGSEEGNRLMGAFFLGWAFSFLVAVGMQYVSPSNHNP